MYRDRYFDLNVRHFHKKLGEEHQIGLSYTWVKQALQAAGLALINALGSVGGFIAPNVKVWADQFFRSPRAGTLLLAGVTIFTAGLIAIIGGSRPRTKPVG